MKTNWRLILIVLWVVASVAPAKAQIAYYGRANGLEVSVLSLLNFTVADTGWLPTSGGNLTNGVASASVLSGPTTVATTGIISTQTTGAAAVVNSVAQVDGLRIFPGLIPALDLVNATVVRSTANATLSSTLGTSTVSNLFVLGNSVTVTGAPNQMVSVPGVLNLTINRQTVTGGVLRVDALYLDILSPLNAGTISVASSYAGVSAPEPSSACLAGLAIPGLCGIIVRRRRSCVS